MTLSKINSKIVSLSSIICLSGYTLTVLTGLKIHYFVFSFLSLLLFFFNIKSNIPKAKILYFTTLLISVTHFLLTKPLDLPFIYSSLNYIIIPLIFFSSNFNNFNFNNVKKIFIFFTFINCIGLILQVQDVESIFLQKDFTLTDEVLHDRYGSFIGGTLVLGFVASISTIFSLHSVIVERKKDILSISSLVISLLTLIIAQSRRFYVLILLIICLMFFFSGKKKINKKKIIKSMIIISMSIFMLVIGLYQFKNDNYYASRFFSTFDFKYDASNALRILMWIKAFNTFIDNFWFGIGMGGIGTIGKDVFDNLKDVEDLFVSESYYLKNFVEGGVFFGTFCFLFSFHILKKALRSIKSSSKSTAAYIFIFMFFDSFVSTSLETVIAILLYWICVSIIFFKDDKTTKEAN